MDDRVFELLCRWDEAAVKPPLEQLCRDAPELLGELKRLVGAVQRADGQMQRQSAMPQEPTQASKAKSHTPQQTVHRPRIEGYEILEQLGEGGMGVVWMAIQISTKRRVALKLMSAAAFGSDRARKRFEREVELAARHDHPHIARVYDSGEDRGVLYYAMELVDGTRLDTYCEKHQLTQRAIAELMLLVCRAVEHAHQRGIIHRDLKPSNIMVSRNGEPRVLDFGLARDLESGPAISIDGDVAGTPAYMSPEQARGQRDKVDTYPFAQVVPQGWNDLAGIRELVLAPGGQFTEALGSTDLPGVVESRFLYNNAVPQLELTFSEPVNAPLAADLPIRNISTNTAIMPTAIQGTGSKRLLVSLPTSLGTGQYELVLPDGSVTDLGGKPNLAHRFAQADEGQYDFFILAGDANRDRQIDIDDYFLIDCGYAMGRQGFGNGDFNYDGAIDSDDYFAIDMAYLTGARVAVPPSLSTSNVTPASAATRWPFATSVANNGWLGSASELFN